VVKNITSVLLHISCWIQRWENVETFRKVMNGKYRWSFMTYSVEVLLARNVKQIDDWTSTWPKIILYYKQTLRTLKWMLLRSLSLNRQLYSASVGYWALHIRDVKNVFYVFYLCHVFTFFNVFLFQKRFLL